jgi:hypothetical protein
MAERLIEAVPFTSARNLREVLQRVILRTATVGSLRDPEHYPRDAGVELPDGRPARAFEILEREDAGVKTLAIRFVPGVIEQQSGGL